MEFLVFLFIFILLTAAVFASFFFNTNAKDSAAALPQLTNCPTDFVPTLVYMEKYGSSGIAFDQESNADQISVHNDQYCIHADMLK